MSDARVDHERWAESLGAWLLGALPEDEAEDFRSHLAECPVCQEDAQGLQVAVDALPMAAPPLAAPPELKKRIMDVVERQATPARRPRRLPAWLTGFTLRPALALPAAVLLLVIGGAAGALLAAEDVRTVPAEVAAAGARATLEVGDERARLVGDRLPPPRRGRVYQVWLDRGGASPEPTPALFTPTRDGRASVDVPGSLDGVRRVMVTDEPIGGSRRPMGRVLVVAQLD
jgi:anti-sigma factor RsiW